LEIELGWEPPYPHADIATITGYKVYRDNVAITEIITELSYIDHDVIAEKEYEYFVTVIYEAPASESTPSNKIKGVPLAPAVFNPPSNFKAIAGYGESVLTWEPPYHDANSATLVGYKVQRGAGNGNDISELITALRFSDKSVIHGTGYRYQVTAYYTDPEGSARTPNAVTVYPNELRVFNAPQALEATAGNGTVTLKWLPPEIHELSGTLGGYKVYRDEVVVTEIIQTLGYTDTGLTNLTEYMYYVVAHYNDPVWESEPSNVVKIIPTVSDSDITLLNRTTLLGNYPNPFNPETIISFSVASDTMVNIEVFNVKGQKITTITNRIYRSGKHQVVFNGKDSNGQNVSSGVYLYKMTTPDHTEIKKMILIK